VETEGESFPFFLSAAGMRAQIRLAALAAPHICADSDFEDVGNQTWKVSKTCQVLVSGKWSPSNYMK
jgi:hypothetical protein